MVDLSERSLTHCLTVLKARRWSVAGRRFTVAELELLRETVALFPRLSFMELADTLCDLLSWVTPNGTYRTASCLKLLERLAEEGEVELPHRRACRPSAERAWVFGPATDPSPPLVARLADLELVSLQPVTTRVERDLWQEYVHRYHPLGYPNSASSQRPFGAHLRKVCGSYPLRRKLWTRSGGTVGNISGGWTTSTMIMKAKGNAKRKRCPDLSGCEETWEAADPKTNEIVEKHSRHAWLSSRPLNRQNPGVSGLQPCGAPSLEAGEKPPG